MAGVGCFWCRASISMIEQNKYKKNCEFPCNGEPIDEKKLTIYKSIFFFK